MKLIFIRHAEPDYSIDSLTEKGFYEAGLLAKRTAAWHVTDFFCSPLGRAIKTSEPTLACHGRTATIYDWLQEFRIPVSSEGRPDGKTIPWDFMPEYLNRYPELLDADRWLDTPVMKSGNVKEAYNNVCQSFDALLEKYGYVREGLAYSTTHTQSSCGYMVYNGTTKECISNHTDDEPVLVFFCHLGIMLCIMSHLLNTSPVTLWQGFFTPPSSVTVLSAEERIPGLAYFRCQMLGDTSHLRLNDEPVSYYGGFAPPFQG